MNNKHSKIFLKFSPIIPLVLFLCSTLGHSQNYYKWVDANGSTHYTVSPPPQNVKKLGSVSTYQNTNEPSKNSPSSQKPIQNPYHAPIPTTPKDKFTAAERAEIEIQVKQQLQQNKKDPYASMFGGTNEKYIRASMEAAYEQKKEKLANTKSALH